MAAWVWQAGPWNAGPQLELNEATNKTVTWRRSDSDQAGFTLPGTHRSFGKIFPLVTDLWLTRDGDVQFRGRNGPRNGAGNLVSTSRDFSAVSYRAVLGRRLLAGHNFTASDPTDNAWQLLVDEQTRPGSNLGIVRGTRRPSAAIATSNAEAGQPVADAITTQAGLVAGGADWDITATSIEGLQFDFWPNSRGTDRGILIDVGGRAVKFTDAVATDAYADAVRLKGTKPDVGADPGWIWFEAADIVTRPEGRWDLARDTVSTTVAALNAEGPQALAAAEVVPITWTATLARGWWQGRDHLDVGDPFRWVNKAPGYDVDEILTVEEITADFSKPAEDGDEHAGEPEVSITFGAPPINARWRRRRVNQQLAALSRR